MKQFLWSCIVVALLPAMAQQRGQQPQPQPVTPTAEEKRQIQSKTDELGGIVRKLKAGRVNEDLVADVEVYEKAGRMPLEFPDDPDQGQRRIRSDT